MLRRQGKSRSQIKQILGPMSNSTLNNALKDEPPPQTGRPGYAESRRRATAASSATGPLSISPGRPRERRSALRPRPRSGR